MKLNEIAQTQEYIAPNGKPSNLPPKLWEVVRTDNFKNWFGDWEKDPQNASKVIDENGEPMVVYHGTQNYGFDEFRTNSDISDLIFFSEEYSGASIFAVTKGSEVYACFLNIRKPYKNGRIFKSTEEIETKIKAERSGCDGFAVADYSLPSGFAEKNWAVWNPKQIKSIDNNGNFNTASANIFT